MKKSIALILSILMVLPLTLGLVSCQSGDDAGAFVNSYYVGEMYNFDPAAAVVDDDAMRVLSLLYEPLFRLKESGKVEKALAKSYEFRLNERTDELQLTILLEEAYWSDGNRVTAYNVHDAWKRIIRADSPSQAAPLLYSIKNAVKVKTGEMDSEDDFGVTADNETTLVITFESKDVDRDEFLRNLTSIALSPIPNSAVGAKESYWAKNIATLVTNGPFTVSTLDYTLGQFTVARNKYYNRTPEDKENTIKDEVTPDRIFTEWGSVDARDFDFISSITAEYKSNDANYQALADKIKDEFAAKTLFLMSELPLALREEYEKDAKFEDILSTYSILFNLKNGRSAALKDKNVRLALAAAIDRQKIADILVFAKPATGFVSHKVFDSTSKKTEFREEGGDLFAGMSTAEAYLVQAGSYSAYQKKIKLACNNTEADVAVATYLKTTWDALGFEVEIVPLGSQKEEYLMDPADPTSKLTVYGSALESAYTSEANSTAHTYDMLLVDYQMLAANPFVALCGFHSTMNGNGLDLKNDANGIRTETKYTHISGYVSEAYDAKIEAAYAEQDLEARAALLHEAEEILLGDMPVIPLTFGQSYYVKSNKIGGIKTDYYGYPILTKMSLSGYKKYLPEQ